jgi:MFS family permease
LFDTVKKIHLPPALHHRDYALLWAGVLISNAGSQMQLWSIFWHLRLLSDQPIVVSGIGIARFVPILVFALIGGLVADTFNRKTVVLVTQTAMLAVATALGALTASGQINLWWIYALVILQGISIAFDGPSRQSLIPNLVPREDLPSAFGLQSIAANVGAVAGPALSGWVIASIGIQWSYWINAISFLGVIAAVLMMGPIQGDMARRQGGIIEGRVVPRLDLSEIPVGIRFILHQPIILSSMILDFFATFFSSANTLLPFVAQDVLHVGSVGYGWLAAGQSIGSLVVAFIMSQRKQILGQGRLLLAAVAGFGVATILFGLSRTNLLTMAALILVGGSDTISTVLRNTIRQLQTPDALRGRMVSINQIFFMGGPQLGEVEAGIVAQAFGTPAAIITGGIGCILSVAVITARFPQLRNYNGDEAVAAGSQV